MNTLIKQAKPLIAQTVNTLLVDSSLKTSINSWRLANPLLNKRKKVTPKFKEFSTKLILHYQYALIALNR